MASARAAVTMPSLSTSVTFSRGTRDRSVGPHHGRPSRPGRSRLGDGRLQSEPVLYGAGIVRHGDERYPVGERGAVGAVVA